MSLSAAADRGRQAADRTIHAVCNDVLVHEAVDHQAVGPASAAKVVDAVVQASRALVAVAARSIAEYEGAVTLPQYRVLVVLASQGPRRVADLAEALVVSPSTATRMCDRLVDRRLVRRQRQRQDRRSVVVGVTDSGLALVADVTARRRAEIERIVTAMPPATRGPLVEALQAFAAAAGEVPEQAWSLGWQG